MRKIGERRLSLLASACALFATLLLSKLLGLLRQALIGKFYGVSSDLDAFYAATNATTILSLVVSNVLVAALIPSLALGEVPSPQETLRQIRRGFHKAASLSVGCYLLLYLTTPLWMRAVAGGFAPQTFELAVTLARWSLFYFLFHQLGSFFQVVLQSQFRFLPIVLWQLIPNVVFVAALVFFAEHGVAPLVVAFVLTGSLYALFMLPPFMRVLRHLGDELATTKGPAREALSLPAAAVGTVGFTAFPLLETAVASFAAEGSVSLLRYAFFLFSLPEGLILRAVSMVLLPTLAAAAGDGDLSRFRRQFSAVLRILVWLTLPMTLLLTVAALPLCRFLYERGAFAPEWTRQTAVILQAYGWGLPLLVVRSLLFSALVAARKPRPLAWGGVCFVTVYLGSAAWLRHFFHGAGVAAAFSLTNLLLVGFYAEGMRRAGLLRPQLAGQEIAKLLLATGGCGLLLGWTVMMTESSSLVNSVEGRVLQVTLLAFVTAGSYAGLSWLLRVSGMVEIADLASEVLGRLRGRAGG